MQNGDSLTPSIKEKPDSAGKSSKMSMWDCDGERDGIVICNPLASFAHLRDSSLSRWF
jgi:hypothetical protein